MEKKHQQSRLSDNIVTRNLKGNSRIHENCFSTKTLLFKEMFSLEQHESAVPGDNFGFGWVDSP